MAAMAEHSYSSCERQPCQRCEDHAAGYFAGKDKAHFEVRSWRLGEHADDCACSPCETVRLVLMRLRAGPVEPSSRRRRACYKRARTRGPRGRRPREITPGNRAGLVRAATPLPLSQREGAQTIRPKYYMKSRSLIYIHDWSVQLLRALGARIASAFPGIAWAHS